MMQKKKVIFDCDPGHDDAFGMILACANLDVLGITTIGGNCSVEAVTKNALKVLDVLGKDIKVYPGCSQPMVAPLITAPQFHGKTGLDLKGGRTLPDSKRLPEKQHAIDFIIETIMNTDDVTIIATGPLTNVAMALTKEPKIASRIKEIAIMGGSVTFGNWTAAAEYNIYVDPEAASVVFNSGVLVKMSGLNFTRQCCILQQHCDQFRAIGNRVGDMAADLAEYFIDSTIKSAQLTGANMHDACAVAWVIDDSLVKSAPMHIDVELNGTLTRGMTVCDYRHLRGIEPAIDLYRTPQLDFRGKAPNALAGLELDVDGFMNLLYRSIQSYK